MKKLILSLLVMMLCLGSVCSAESAPTYTCGDYEYTLLEDGTAQIVGYKGKEKDLIVPAELDGHPVTNFAFPAFVPCHFLTSVVFPEGVLSTGDKTFFGNENLTTVVLPSTITSIGNSAFFDCAALTSITLPTVITPVIPENAVIHNFAFWNCESLTSICIPEGITAIRQQAFENCKSLTSVTIPASVTSISESAFFGRSDTLTFTVVPGSYAEEYAKERHIDYVYAEETALPNE